MKQIKQIKDKVRDEMMLILFKYSSLDMNTMKTINIHYENIYRRLILQVIIWVSIISVNIMSLLYIKTFIQVSFWQSLIAFVFATIVMKKILNLFAKIIIYQKQTKRYNK